MKKYLQTKEGVDIEERMRVFTLIRDMTADAFGVLPPIARLSPEAAMYHFLSGYTAKVAGTERGVTEPTATFSTCFGAPFMVWPPTTYASLLGERLAAHGANAWLVNTGWTGGPFGVGHRMPIAHTRALIAAALSGALDDGPFETDPVFNVDVPLACPGVPAEVYSLAARGPTRPTMMRRRASSGRCLRRTSRPSRRRPRWRRPVLGSAFAR